MQASRSRLSSLMFGAGATAAEARTALLFGVCGMIVAAGCALAASWTLVWWQWALLLILAFDIVGGVAANATAAATRQYHRPGRPFGPLLFSTLHIQPFLFAWLFPSVAWEAALALWASAMIGTLAVIIAPIALKRGVALGYCALALGVLGALTPTLALAWLAPAFLIKLVAAHAVPHAPIES